MAAGRPQNVRQGPLSSEGGTIGECGETCRLRTTPLGRLVVTRKRTWGRRQAPGGGGGEGVCKWQNLCRRSASKGGSQGGTEVAWRDRQTSRAVEEVPWARRRSWASSERPGRVPRRPAERGRDRGWRVFSEDGVHVPMMRAWWGHRPGS